MAESPEPFLRVRGVVLTPSDVSTWDWPQVARAAGLNTVALYGPPDDIAQFLRTDRGAAYLETCAALGLEIEYELHAARELLPRDLFPRDPTMFRMDEHGERVRDWNLCVHSELAVLPTDTGDSFDSRPELARFDPHKRHCAGIAAKSSSEDAFPSLLGSCLARLPPVSSP